MHGMLLLISIVFIALCILAMGFLGIMLFVIKQKPKFEILPRTAIKKNPQKLTPIIAEN